jgi:TDG/mug DNA glycosylase family protein
MIDRILPDVLAPGLRVVFCGTAASTASARVGAYYAGPGNRFWPTLHLAGFTPRLLVPAEFRELLTWGIGLTDVCTTHHGMDRDIADAQYDIPVLERAMARMRPGILAFTSKQAGRAAFGLRSTGELDYGRQARTVSSTPTWILPSPSGAARRFWSASPWVELARVASAKAW